jgi:hypothetical protein
MTAMIQFQSQLEAVDKATPRDRIGRGKISPMRTQAPDIINFFFFREWIWRKLTRTPGSCEKEDVDANEGDLRGNSSVVVLTLTTGSNTNDTNNELADQHAESSPDEDGTTSVTLNDVERDRSRADIDQSGDETDEEGVRNRAQSLEESGTKVENEVDTSPLLHHLEGGSEDGSAQVGRWVSETALEAVQPSSKVTRVWDNGQFVLVICDDFSQFLLDVFGAFGFTT